VTILKCDRNMSENVYMSELDSLPLSMDEIVTSIKH